MDFIWKQTGDIYALTSLFSGDMDCQDVQRKDAHLSIQFTQQKYKQTHKTNGAAESRFRGNVRFYRKLTVLFVLHLLIELAGAQELRSVSEEQKGLVCPCLVVDIDCVLEDCSLYICILRFWNLI